MIKLFYARIDDAFRSEIVKKCGFAGKKKNLDRQIVKFIGAQLVRYALKQEFRLEQHTVPVIKNPHGKPYWEGLDNAYYNISHSGEYVVCAVSGTEIGVDIEKITTPRMEVARRFFHPEEVAGLEAVMETQKQQLFFTCWSAKESFLKYKGTGLSGGMAAFHVKIQNNTVKLYEGAVPLPVFLHACLIDTAYTCFVCGAHNDTPELIPVAPRTLLL